MKRRSLIIYFSFFCFVLILSMGHFSVYAQRATQWRPFEHVPGYLDDTLPPYLVADQNRTVHAFTSQWVGDDFPQKAIVYRQWSPEDDWTSPIDILLSPDGDAQILDVFLDRAGMMHVIFLGGESRAANIYYSKAPAESADRAPAWSTPKLVGSNAVQPGSAAITGDGQGNLTIIYNANLTGNGVYGLYSSDSGDSWSEPQPVFLTLDNKLTPFSLQMDMGQAGQMHAVWNVVDATGVDISLHYARLDVAGQQWTEPIVLDQRIEQEDFFGPSFPRIVDNGEDLVVMYNSGNPSAEGPVAAGRPVQRVRISADSGNTWGSPTEPFPRHLGRSGAHALVVDSSGIVHALFIQRIEPNIDGPYVPIAGLWHSELRDGRWTEPDRIDLGKLSGHDVQAVVSQGNVLLATMREDPGQGQLGVFYSYTTLDATELPVVPLPTATLTPTSAPMRTATPVTLTPTPLPIPAAADQGDDLTASSGDPGRLLALGVVPVILVLAGIIVVQQFSHYRRR